MFVCLVCCGLSRLWLVSVAVWVATPDSGGSNLKRPLFVVQMAGPVAGMAGGVAALFRPEAGPCLKKGRLFFLARGRYERPLSVARDNLIPVLAYKAARHFAKSKKTGTHFR